MEVKLARLGEQEPDRAWQPLSARTLATLDIPATGSVSFEERFAYQTASERHEFRHPGYALGWVRPSTETASEVWDLLASKLGAQDLLPDPVDGLPVTERVKQAFTVTLAVAVRCGRRGRLLTQSRLFDALALAFSDHYRRAYETGPAQQVRDMLPETASHARRFFADRAHRRHAKHFWPEGLSSQFRERWFASNLIRIGEDEPWPIQFASEIDVSS